MVVNMVELDDLLSVIENPARRRILEALVREPHYPLQLSKELGMSQQAVMKHLKVLESVNLVRSYPEESDLGGPMRKKYFPALNFTIVVDLGPNLFSAELFSREWEGPRSRTEELEELDSFKAKVDELRAKVGDIDTQLDALHRKRSELIEEKEEIMEEVARLADRMQDYQIRKILYEFISHPDLDPEEIARELSVRDEIVMRTLKDWMNR